MSTVSERVASLRHAIGPDDPDYDEARKVYNGMIDKRPALIARCSDAADVIAALELGREGELAIAIRGGGHNGGGLGSVDDGLVIDLSPLKGVRVDPRTKTVQVAGGALLGEVDTRRTRSGSRFRLGSSAPPGSVG